MAQLFYLMGECILNKENECVGFPGFPEHKRCPQGTLQSPIGTRKVGSPCKDDFRFSMTKIQNYPYMSNFNKNVKTL